MDLGAKIYVAGHTGLLGTNLISHLKNLGAKQLLVRTHAELDLRDAAAVRAFFDLEKPDYVFHAAARVGSIQDNAKHPADYLADNLAMELNVLSNAARVGVKKLLFYASNCAYPLKATQPYREEDLFTGRPEPTNEAYAVAKLTGLQLCRAYGTQHGAHFLSAIPASIYGPHDHFDGPRAHVIPSLFRRFEEAHRAGTPNVELWGTGRPLREYMHVQDAVKASLFLMDHYTSLDPINIGTGEEVSIFDLARTVAGVVGFQGEIRFNSNYPDGALRKCLNHEKILTLGWRPTVSLEQGLRQTYDWYTSQSQRGGGTN